MKKKKLSEMVLEASEQEGQQVARDYKRYLSEKYYSRSNSINEDRDTLSRIESKLDMLIEFLIEENL